MHKGISSDFHPLGNHPPCKIVWGFSQESLSLQTLLQGFSQLNFKSILADQVWSQIKVSLQESEEGTVFNQDAVGSLLPSSCFDCKIPISTKKKKINPKNKLPSKTPEW